MKPRRPRKKVPPSGAWSWSIVFQTAAIIVAAIVIYLPAVRGGFVWDDELLITKNPLLESWAGLREIWGFGRTADYFPLTNTVFWMEWHVFGQSPAGYHVVNIVVQTAGALLLWIVLRRLQLPGAWLTAVIFAVHPVHAESVAWISELKNVLSMFWALLSVLLFFRFVDGKTSRPRLVYVLSLGCFVLALLSKTQVVFLPAALLLLIWWRDSAPPIVRSPVLDRHRRVLLATTPFFALALVLGLITVFFQNRGLGEEQVILGGAARRLVNAGMAVWWYVGKLVAPVRLMPIYPSWRFTAPTVVEWLPLLALFAVAFCLWHWRDQGTRGSFVALSGFVVALAPVLGFLPMSYVRSGALVADHYQYFADVFLIALFGTGVARLWERAMKPGKVAVTLGLTGLLTALAVQTSTRAAVYRDEETLWRDNLDKNPDAWQAHNRLGQIYFNQERFQDAAPHFQRAAALKPELADNHNQLGLVYCRLGQFEQGIDEYRTALRLKQRGTVQPTAMATIRTNLANALTITANTMSESSHDAISQEQARSRYREAVEQYEEALKIEPLHPAIHRNLGMLLARLGRYREAADHLRKVLEIVPNEPNARELLQALEKEGAGKSQ